VEKAGAVVLDREAVESVLVRVSARSEFETGARRLRLREAVRKKLRATKAITDIGLRECGVVFVRG